jgi:ribonuclease HII
MVNELDSEGLKAKFDLSIPFSQIPNGDQKIASIAAASILAKVARDRIMKQFDLMHSNYGFAKHKGYGTALHKKNLSRFGVSAIHRKSYAPIRNLSLCPNPTQLNQSKTSLIRAK